MTVLARAGRVVRTARRHLDEAKPLARLSPPSRSDARTPRVGVVGYYGWGNYGDELFLEVFREHLSPALEIRSLIRPDPPPSAARWLGSEIRAVDSVLIGGGDLLIPWARGGHYWQPAYLRRPVVLAGIGVPLWRPPEPHVVDRLRRFLRHPNVAMIGTRDTGSTEWIRSAIEPSAPVVTAPDLVWSLTLPPVVPPPGPPILGVIVRASSAPDYLAQVRGLCLRAMERGYRIRRIALATGRTRHIDVEALEGLQLGDTELVASDDLDELTRSIGECSLVASMKFHGVIVATMFGVPAIALGATTKHRNLMAALGRPELNIKYSDPALPDVLDRELVPLAPATLEDIRRASIENVIAIRDRLVGVSDPGRR